MYQFTSLNDLTSSELLELLCFIQGMKVEQEEFINFYEGLSDIQKSIWVNIDVEERQIRDIVEKFLLISEKESLTQLYKLSEKRLGNIKSSLENIKIDIRFKKFGQYIFQTDIQTLPIKIKQLDLGDIDKISEVSLSDLEKQLNEVEFKIAQKGAVKAKADLKLRNVPKITAVKGQIATRIRDFTDVVGANLQTKLKAEILAGIKAGEGTSDIAKRIRGVYKKPVPIDVKPLIRDGKTIRAGYSYSISNKRWSEMVARSESSWSVNQGRVEAYKSSGLVRNVTWQTAAHPCPDCAIMEGQVLELYEAENMIPYHVHCLTSDKTKIYTVEGYKQFKHLKNSDYVLTHKGKFRKIKKILKNDRYNLDVYTFIIKNDGFSDRTGQYKLTVTYDHPILTSNGWKSAKDITYEDKIIMLGSKCKYCGKIFVGSNHECCSFSHTAKYKVTNQWKKLRKKMLKALRSVKWSEERKENSKRILKKARNKLKKEHRLGFQNKQVQDKAQKTININTKNGRLRGFQIKHVRDAAFKSLGKLQISSLEVLLYQYLKELGIKNIKKQFNIGNYYVDLYLPKYNLALEADGYYHRFSKLRDKKRDIEIKKQGHDILRLNSSVIQDENHCKTILTNILKNHANQFIFVESSIARIQKKFKKHQTSFNLEVEEDESFIAKDFVVHNCKCTWTVNAYKSVDEKLPEPPTQFSDELYDKPNGVGISGIIKMSPGDERIFDRALELGNAKQAEKLMRHQHIRLSMVDYSKIDSISNFGKAFNSEKELITLAKSTVNKALGNSRTLSNGKITTEPTKIKFISTEEAEKVLHHSVDTTGGYYVQESDTISIILKTPIKNSTSSYKASLFDTTVHEIVHSYGNHFGTLDAIEGYTELISKTIAWKSGSKLYLTSFYERYANDAARISMSIGKMSKLEVKKFFQKIATSQIGFNTLAEGLSPVLNIPISQMKNELKFGLSYITEKYSAKFPKDINVIAFLSDIYKKIHNLISLQNNIGKLSDKTPKKEIKKLVSGFVKEYNKLSIKEKEKLGLVYTELLAFSELR